jgi:hypothetical protein
VEAERNYLSKEKFQPAESAQVFRTGTDAKKMEGGGDLRYICSQPKGRKEIPAKAKSPAAGDTI